MSCFGCEVREEARNMDVAALIAEQLSLETDRCDAATAQHRIRLCEGCQFRSQHTCVKCGCFYAFRAQLALKNCPVGRW